MNRDTFLGWLTGWLSRHPLRTPASSGSSAYAKHVMARIRALSSPKRRIIPVTWAGLIAWVRGPRLALALSAATALVVAGFTLRFGIPHRTLVMAHLDRELQVLAEVEALPDPLALEPSAETLEEELRFMDRMMLAQAGPVDEDEAWIEETLELLDEVEEVPKDPTQDPQAADEWWEELQELDETARSLT